MKVGIPSEVYPKEARVAASPDTVTKLKALGYEVCVQSGAGQHAHFSDADYEAAGASVLTDAAEVWASDVVLKVRAPMDRPDGSGHESALLKEGATLIAFLAPDQSDALLAQLAERGVSAVAVEKIPRITRAQKMDALSSLANIAGYRSVLEAATYFGRFFTGQITAAGRLAPAKVLVIGAGVAGLQAIATAKSMGAIVRAFDTREACREQVTSFGAEFLEVEFEESGEGAGGYAKVMSPEFIAAEMDLFRKYAVETDIVITTALIPGRPAPKLWLADMVELMPNGGVVVDLAASQGGNCELTEPGEVVVKHGVTLVGHEDLTSRLATTASQLYSTNLYNLVEHMTQDGQLTVDLEDEIVLASTAVKTGEVVWPPPKPAAPPPPPPKPAPKAEAPAPKVAPASSSKPSSKPSSGHGHGDTGGGSGAVGWIMLAVLVLAWGSAELFGHEPSGEMDALRDFLQHFTVFVLACFVGWQVIWNVSPALHTPLMSVTNAISGIILVGGMLHASGDLSSVETMLGLAAVGFATLNVSGGFLVTQRMLRMFRK
ncbi:MAG: Re/Si-specific NAD(P)(+) transhydrogenase subunit alpha [Myxococcota bacterium]